MNGAIEHLKRCGVRPSVQRAAIMDYLLNHRTHPTVDEIYCGLKESMPTLSRATVYNTLSLLESKNALLALTIDSKNVRYDGYTHPHAHFRCTNCDRVLDVDLTPEAIEALRGISIPGAKTNSIQTYFVGVCPECNRK